MSLACVFFLTFSNFHIALDRKGSNYSNDIAYLTERSRHRQIIPIGNSCPLIGQETFLAPNATLGIDFC